MTMPNFIIIGASKTGTSSLHRYLSQHPDIYLPGRKSTNFFAFEGKKPKFSGPGDDLRENQRTIISLEEYVKVFDGVSTEQAIGEISPIYFDLPQRSAGCIKKYIPEIKLICILRNPIDSAYSRFCHLIRSNCEPIIDFSKALTKEEERISENYAPLWHYKKQGFHYKKLEYYLALFKREQIKIFIYDDFCVQPIKLLQELFRFLGVDDNFSPDISLRYNTSETLNIQKKKWLHNFITKPNPAKSILRPILPKKLRQRFVLNLKSSNLKKTQLSPETKKHLIEIYREDILKLQKLLQRDLSKWLE